MDTHLHYLKVKCYVISLLRYSDSFLPSAIGQFITIKQIRHVISKNLSFYTIFAPKVQVIHTDFVFARILNEMETQLSSCIANALSLKLSC